MSIQQQQQEQEYSIGSHGLNANLSIVDEGAIVKQHVEGHFIPSKHDWTNFKPSRKSII